MQQPISEFIGLLKALIPPRFRSADRAQPAAALTLVRFEPSETEHAVSSRRLERDVEITMNFLRARDERLGYQPSQDCDDQFSLALDDSRS